MEYLIQFQLSLFSVIILGVLYATIKIRSGIANYSKLLLQTIIILSIIGIIVEPLTWIFDGALFDGAYFLEYFTNFLVILMAPIIGGFALSYVDYYILHDRLRIRKLWYFYPAFLTFILLIVNMVYPFYFGVSHGDNVYWSGELNWLQNVILCIMYFYIVAFVIKHRKKTFPYIVNIFVVFLILPLVGIAVQTFSSRLYFAWASIALSILVIYIFLETTTGEKDHLTKLFSRQSYEKYVSLLIETKKPFEVVLIDLDNFKAINDKCGHLCGDQVLVLFSDILIEAFSPNRIVCRLAGDEFMVIVENEILINKVISNIYERFSESVNVHLRGLRFSYGCQRYHEGMSMDELYTKVDKKMYEDKIVNNSSNMSTEVDA